MRKYVPLCLHPSIHPSIQHISSLSPVPPAHLHSAGTLSSPTANPCEPQSPYPSVPHSPRHVLCPRTLNCANACETPNPGLLCCKAKHRHSLFSFIIHHGLNSGLRRWQATEVIHCTYLSATRHTILSHGFHTWVKMHLPW